MAINTHTFTTRLIQDTKTTIKENNKFSSTYPKNKIGLRNTYSVLGLIVSIETTKERGWNAYETYVRVSHSHHWGTPDGFSEWYKEFRTSLGSNNHAEIRTNNTYIERHSQSLLENTHAIGVLTSESYALTIINKYIELLFNSVDKEVITRQINELQSQLATIA